MKERYVSLGEKENVLIANGDCCVTILPGLGGKISSIRIRGRELLQLPLAPALPRTPDLPFDQSDASGWDECAPSVAACTVETADGAAHVPDHGDLWRVVWEPVEGSREPASLRAACFSLPLQFMRTVTLRQSPHGWHLNLDYTVTNTGAKPVPWSWSAHPLFAVEPGDHIEMPAAVSALRLEGSGDGRLGAAGAAVSWPMARLVSGEEADLRLVLPASSGVGDKLFAGPLAGPDGWCILHRPSAGLRIKMSFDASRTPYLGLWICYGGWPDRPGPRQNCVAFEPATAPVDSLAQTGSWSRTLLPADSFSWSMAVEFNELER